ncbi:MAG TPA: uroporphyrinogen-III C-methyltransferase [Epulopiscium sp.]|nr:uroporphyrinogen-III C-methyltransferase [Candidatus Epulonipiscium sp.]
MGKVYLIGGGPGDETLLTLKAAEVLGKCTAVMYDRLAGEKYLKYLNDSCEIYYCGKEPGAHSKTQEEINDLLVQLAQQGHIVGRIKGGDPYVFGRGGEEALRLHEEGIPFEVIPGVTSAIAVLNYAGIPITHRGIAQSFHVFTGMSVDKLNINWEAVGKLEGTLVFLMGLGNLDNIVEQLISNGKKEDMPCAVIMQGTTSKQQKAIGTLKSISNEVQKRGFTSPCIIVVGEVINFSNELGWYENKPLFGRNICITRTKKQSDPLRKQLLDLGAEVTQINPIEIKEAKEKLTPYKDEFGEYDFVVFTSVNGVEIFFDYLIENEIDVRTIKGKFAAIGPATLKAIRKYGIVTSILAKEFVAEDLFIELQDYVQKGDKILLPTSSQARDYLTVNLEKCGAIVDRVDIYSPEMGVAREDFDNADIVLFTSPSTFKNTVEIIGLNKIKEKIVVAIGPITEKEMRLHDINPYVCGEYSSQAMIKKLLELAGENKI